MATPTPPDPDKPVDNSLDSSISKFWQNPKAYGFFICLLLANVLGTIGINFCTIPSISSWCPEQANRNLEDNVANLTTTNQQLEDNVANLTTTNQQLEDKVANLTTTNQQLEDKVANLTTTNQQLENLLQQRQVSTVASFIEKQQEVINLRQSLEFPNTPLRVRIVDSKYRGCPLGSGVYEHKWFIEYGQVDDSGQINWLDKEFTVCANDKAQKYELHFVSDISWKNRYVIALSVGLLAGEGSDIRTEFFRSRAWQISLSQ
ncbi:MAG: hypothetical protein QNJ42_09555 [Crocosphaera sp.]|nr:hypothetical protein [Crocosphaera sp.]